MHSKFEKNSMHIIVFAKKIFLKQTGTQKR